MIIPTWVCVFAAIWAVAVGLKTLLKLTSRRP